MRWAAYCTKLGDAPTLIGIEMQRSDSKRGGALVYPKRQPDESREATNAKFHNDIKIYKQFFKLLANNPRLASCSMVSAMRLEDRLEVPGQSKHLMWVSGDFSIEGQAFGVEGLHPTLGYVKKMGVHCSSSRGYNQTTRSSERQGYRGPDNSVICAGATKQAVCRVSI